MAQAIRENLDMSPLLVAFSAFMIFRIAGAAGIEPFTTWQASMRFGLGVTFVLMGSGHFTRLRHKIVGLIPSSYPNPGLLVTVSGVWQLAGGVGLLVLPFSRIAGYGLIIEILLKLPVNVHAARAHLALGGRWATPPWLRLPLQVGWIVLLWWSIRGG